MTFYFLKKCSLAGVRLAHTLVHTHVHTHTQGQALLRVIRGGPDRSGLPDGEFERPSRNRWDENGGMLGTRGTEGGKVGREHRQFRTTIIAAHTALHLPPLILLHRIPSAAR